MNQLQVGAGISTSAGIPDFRTPGTGLYSNLQKLNLPYPEAVFDISYFKDHPEAFYTLANDLYPSKFKPTLFHVFIKLIEKKGCLKKVFTQNIDTLERLATVDGDKVIEAHGSFAMNHCISCGAEMSTEELKRQMYGLDEAPQTKKNDAKHTESTILTPPPDLKPGQKVGIPRCKNPKCSVEGGGLVKPDIVFFGEGLPQKFFQAWEDDLPDADLAIIAGTSLTVGPFNQLPLDVKPNVPRLLFNMEKVGGIGSRKNDVLALGGCDDQVRNFVKLCGWEEELDELLKEIHENFRVMTGISNENEDESEEPKQETSAELAKEIAEDISKVLPEKTADSKKPKDDVEKEIDRLTDKIDKL